MYYAFDIGVLEAAGKHTPFLDVARYEATVTAVYGGRSYRKMLPSWSVCYRSGVVDAEEYRPWETRLTQFFILQRYLYRAYFC